MAKMKWYDYTSVSLLVAGAVNWGLIGLTSFGDAPTKFNLVDTILANYPTIENIVYLAVGVSGLYTLYWLLFGKK
jgi:uncharacterized protein